MQGAQARSLDLLRRWQCHDEHCFNQNGFCFVDYHSKHYVFNSKEQLQWALAIDRQEPDVSIETPPEQMYRGWTGFNGPVTQTSRRSTQYQERQEPKAEREESKDFFAQYMEFNQQAMKMAMADKMAEQVERMARKKTPPPLSAPPIWQQQQQPQWQQPYQQYPQPPPHPPPPPYWSQQTWPQQPPQYHPLAPSVQQTQYPPTPPPPPPPAPIPARQASPSLTHPASTATSAPAVISSPIDSGNEDEEEVINRFFEWKLGRTKKEVTRAKVREALQIISEQCWNSKDLKEMSRISTPIYQTAVQKGIPEGMVRGFISELKLFKEEWRRAKLVMNIRNAA